MMLTPSLIVADEPLSALDVSIQAQILDLMRDLSRNRNVGFVLISHDLNAVQSIADRIAVMYRGSIVEVGRDILSAPAHPYTRLLLDARLSFDPRQRREVPDHVPLAETLTPLASQGCQFRDRCSLATEICSSAKPGLEPTGQSSAMVACHMSQSAQTDASLTKEKKQKLPGSA
ncbi:oligopeptide/dipeptide ABC transporter ATP-binding protein [Seohaeicola zhoushanensis]